MSKKANHISILLRQVIEQFQGASLKVFFEGTVGAGGHAKAILEAHPEIERYIGCDQDPQALELARKTLESFGDKVELVHGNFRHLDTILRDRGINKVDGFFLTSECRLCN